MTQQMMTTAQPAAADMMTAGMIGSVCLTIMITLPVLPDNGIVHKVRNRNILFLSDFD